MREITELLTEARRRTLDLVARLSDDVMHKPLDPIMSPLVWDLAHIAAYEDLWAVHRLAGEPLLREDLAAVYDAFETPRAVRGTVELLTRNDAIEYMDAVRARAIAVLGRTGPTDLHELVVMHELQHTETMRQALFLGGEPGGEPAATPSFDREPEWVEFDAGEFEMGARRNGRFVYDNELPRHPASTGSFAIQNVPALDETGTPLQHLSWFDADALARRHGARLPTEGEWERAATSGQLDGIGAVWEWTSTDFNGYPGFEPYPYREYSEVFFGENYKVLRGGSWATSPFVATKTFRNWDLPQRSQIFSGVRLAKDL